MQSTSEKDFFYRFFLVLELSTPRRGAAGWLASATGIAEQKWRNLMLGRIAPSIDMTVALCALRPQWAKWLMVGSTDGENEQPPELPELPNVVDLVAKYPQK
jgi:hypothetical protein